MGRERGEILQVGHSSLPGEAIALHCSFPAASALNIARSGIVLRAYRPRVRSADQTAKMRKKARLEGTRPDGRLVRSAMHTLEVRRRQDDDSWLAAADAEGLGPTLCGS